MTIDDLKLYSVIVEQGSGCFIQPMTLEYTYILTAKHNLKDKKINDIIELFRINPENKVEVIPLEHIQFIPGVTWFEHADADVAIIKIPFQNNFDKLFIQSNHNSESGFNLCGFPTEKRANQNNKMFWFKNHIIRNFTDTKPYFQGAEIEKNQLQQNILGISGGGILKIHSNYISIIGVQSEISKSNNPQGEIDFVPISIFNKIIESEVNLGKLEKLYPPYFKSFKLLKDEIIKLEGCIGDDFIKDVRNVIKQKVDELEIYPFEISNSTLLNLMLIAKEPEVTILNKNLWVSWLTYLIILNIVEEKKLSLEEIKVIFNKIRIIHSDTEKDWMRYMKEIFASDFSGLAKEGTLIVSTKMAAKNQIAKFEMSDISRVNPIDGAFKTDQNQHPLSLFKFIHINAFEKECIIDNEMSLKEYTGIEINNLIKHLKIKFDEILQN